MTNKKIILNRADYRIFLSRCDVAVAEDWQNLWTHTEQKFESQVNLLVNNAGLIANWQKSLDIMLYGVCHGTWLAIDKMSVTKGGSGGRIVNIASMAGFLEGTLKSLLTPS